MANIFTPLEVLRNLKKTPNLTAQQTAFLNRMLEALPDILKNPVATKLTYINSLLTEEINQTSYWNITAPLANLKYIRGLQHVQTLLTTLENHFKKIEKPDYVSNISENLSKKIDLIYQETVKTYDGEVMLPIMQGADDGIRPFSEGECFGYVAKWAMDLLTNNCSFGVYVDATPIFSPIKLSSNVGRKYPGLNHLARLTESIADYQTHQKHLKNFLSSTAKSAEKEIFIYDGIFPHFYKSISQIAEDLLKHSNENIVVGLKMHGYRGGHALGFYYKNNKYHFLDCNTGWYRFNTPEALAKWLPFYFQTIGYDKLFLENSIIRYSTKAEIGSELASRRIDSNLYKQIVLHLILSPITVPMITAMLGYYYGVRGLIYGVNNIGNTLSSWWQATPNVVENNSDKNILNNTNPHECSSSYRTINALLDISRSDIHAVEQKTRFNPLFTKSARKSSVQPLQSTHTAAVSKPNTMTPNHLFFNLKNDTIKAIDTLIANIENSSSYYRREAKKQKIIVLKAAKQLLIKEISLEQFELAIKNNSQYADAFGKSNTQELVERALKLASDVQFNESPSTKRLWRSNSMSAIKCH